MTLNPRQFHGTGGPVEGGVVRPARQALPGQRPAMDQLAFASSRVGDAMIYARHSAEREGRLFGSVYEVDPIDPQPSPMKNKNHVVSTEGLKVKKHVGFVAGVPKEPGGPSSAQWVNY